MHETTSLIDHRKARRATIATKAREYRTDFKHDLPRQGLNKLVHQYIRNELPPHRASTQHLQRELADRLADITHARQHPPTHLPCGEDDAWYERLHVYVIETKEIAHYLARQAGLTPGVHPLINPKQHARAGAETCPYCLDDLTRMTSEPEPVSPYALKITRECLECDHQYETTYRLAGRDS